MYSNYQNERDAQESQISISELKSFISKKIQTTMIGSLSSVEQFFGFLWEDGAENGDYYFDLFQKLRSDILDRGNDQIRMTHHKIDSLEIKRRSNIVHFTFNKDNNHGKN